MPVPGDLPVFLRVALAVLRHQQADHRVETLVIPDVVTPAVREIVEQTRADWPGPLRLQPLPVPERWVLPRLNNPGRNHALQLITGTAHSRASHMVLHDADLFLMEPDILDRQYATCAKRRLACLGVSPVWDPWFAAHDRYPAATWELCARADWLKSFVPALHMAHENELFGERHAFDTTLYPQAMTHPDLIGIEPSSDIVHFNYVISHYRHFLSKTATPFTDNRFLLLFIRLLVDLFDASNSNGYRLPSLSISAHVWVDPRQTLPFRLSKRDPRATSISANRSNVFFPDLGLTTGSVKWRPVNSDRSTSSTREPREARHDGERCKFALRRPRV